MFRFTIRDVLWLTVVVIVALAMGVVWKVDCARVEIKLIDFKNRLVATEIHLQELQSILKKNGLEDPGGYYPSPRPSD